MATNIVMPKLGLTMETGLILHWFKAVGDAVAEGESVAEVETDKITSMVEAPVAGTLLKILVAENEEANVLAPIGVIGKPGEV